MVNSTSTLPFSAAISARSGAKSLAQTPYTAAHRVHWSFVKARTKQHRGDAVGRLNEAFGLPKPSE